MSLKSQKQGENSQIILEIEVSQPEFLEAIDRAYKKNVKRIQIPGFRKGHAPRKVIEKMYGEEFFWEDAVNDAYPTVYRAVIEEAGIEPVAPADVEITEVTSDGFTFVATVTVKPDVKLGEYKNLIADKIKAAASDEEVEEELERLQKRNARQVPLADGDVIEAGDTTNINFEGFKNDIAFDGGKGEDFDLVIGSGQFIPGFEEAVIGHTVGETFDIDVTFPDSYHVEDLKGQPVVFKVTINSATREELPELDDEFAKDVSEFDALDELKKDIHHQIEHRAEHASQEQFEDALMEQVVENLIVELPEVMVEGQVDQMVRNLDNRLRQQGLDLGTYISYVGQTLDEVRESMREQATEQLLTRLALETIADEEKIEVSDDEVEAEYKKIAEENGTQESYIKGLITADQIKDDLRVGKALDLVRDTAKANEIDAPKEEETEEEEAPQKKAATKKKAAPQKETAAKKEEADKPAEEK